MATLTTRIDTARTLIKGHKSDTTQDYGTFHKATVIFDDGTGERAVNQKAATEKQALAAALEYVVEEFYTCHACGRVKD